MRVCRLKETFGAPARILFIGLYIYFILIIIIPPVSADNEFENVYIAEDTWFVKQIGYDDPFNKYDVFWAEVNVTSGGPLDVYVLKCSEAEKLKNGTSFKAEVSKERVNITDLKWEKDKTGEFAIVVENMDNARENDAVPTGGAYAHIRFGNGNEGHERTMWLIWVVGGIIGLVIIASTVIWVVWYNSQ